MMLRTMFTVLGEQVVLDRLEANPPADLFYYFCHGFAPGRGGPFKADVLAETLRWVCRALRG